MNKMNKKLILKAVFAALIVISFASCDKDFENVGSGVIGDNHFDLNEYSDATVVAFDHATGPVQTNNLPINNFGFYDHPVYGKTVANFAGQLTLPTASIAPTFGNKVELDSVYFTVPYFSTKESITNGKSVYSLDSVAAGKNAKFDLSIYESGYFINDFDFDQTQKFYNTQDELFANKKKGSDPSGNSVEGGTRLNDAPATLHGWPQNDGFTFSKKEIYTYSVKDGDSTKTRTAPAMRIKLSNAFFQKKILDASADKLATVAAFKDYFRGLYFQVSNTSGTSNLASINFAGGVITMYYTEDKSTTKNGVEVITRVNKTFPMNLSGNTVSLLTNSNNATNSAYLNSIATSDAVNGDTRLYVKGGQGAMTFVDLFGPDKTEIDALKSKKWLINEANLTFYVDNKRADGIADTTFLPYRIYLYDVNNKRQLFDYANDVTTISDPKQNRYMYGGLREKLSDGSYKYKFRITNHIRNIITKDSTNVRLGLVVTESIALTDNLWLQSPYSITAPVGFPGTSQNIKTVPRASVMNPYGVKLYGSRLEATDDVTKKLKLQIYYTVKNQ